MTPLRTFIVCVDYSHELSLTVPYNKHQFQEMHVVTSQADTKTKDICNKEGIRYHETDAFYRNGAHFNKWLALEEGLDHFGRHGWICLLDADVLWPKEAWRSLTQIRPGFLYTPRRRMCPVIPKDTLSIPRESEWVIRYPIHRNEMEFAGYSQIFHAEDTRLPKGHWHETDWKHAGGADSFFQQRWPDAFKVRPAFEVLHLGDAGTNWCGRDDRSKEVLRRLMTIRRTKGRNDPYSHEKIR